MFFAQVGIHPDLSFQELISVYPQAIITRATDRLFHVDRITSSEILSKAHTLGGIIRWMSHDENTTSASELIEEMTDNLAEWHISGKCLFAIQTWGSSDAMKLWMKAKKLLKSSRNISSRFLNQPSWTDIPAAATIGENLITKGNELHIFSRGNDQFTVAKTIWIQDIDAYTKRDTNKMRSMEVGMLPPKLAQIMLNMATWGNTEKTVYDPFCGLWTVLIEAHQAGHQDLLGSDVSADMVRATQWNLLNYGKQDSKIVLMDARNIAHTKFSIQNTCIVTEWTLGTIMTQESIAFPKVEKEIRFLMGIYKDFFAGLKKLNYQWTLIMTTPMWHIKDSTYGLEWFKECFMSHGFKSVGFDFEDEKKTTLLYHRKGQPVGREIWRIKKD